MRHFLFAPRLYRASQNGFLRGVELVFRVEGRAAVMAAGMTVLGLAAGSYAHAADKPSFGPPPGWVDVAPIPDAPAATDVSSQVLLDDNQSRLGPDGDAYYNRRVLRITKAEGLSGLTSWGSTWSPDTEGVTFHTLRILRDGKTIDLLGGGEKMLVLRRERDLESAVLDGRISASQQLEDLRVGDVIDVAWTRTRKDPIEEGHSIDSEALSFNGVAARYRVRVSWPDAQAARWRATPGFGEPVVSKHDGRTFVDLDLKDAKTPRPPAGAPGRFRQVGVMETSSWPSWSEVSRAMYPYYAKAMVADADIKAEAKAIAAAHPDAAGRAYAALQLVESKTRYFLLAMDQGGYVPATAADTWRRKFGDCKGKTVLLLTLLKELGVEAEPVLVNIGGGDGLDERLPALARFNHVLVRARIGGQTYWMDGTRTGDEAGIGALKPPNYRWGLPLRARGAELERIALAPLKEPVVDGLFRLDASQGLDAPVKTTIRMRLTGDAAIGMRTALKVAPPADFERMVKQQFSSSISWMTVQDVKWEDDVAHDAFTTVVSGEGDMPWRLNPDVNQREYIVAQSGGARALPRREPGPNQDAPYAVGGQNYIRATTEVVLPSHGEGFTVRGPNQERTIAGYQLKSTSEVRDGVARFVVETRTVAEEIPASDAETANRQLRDLAAEQSLVRAPR